MSATFLIFANTLMVARLPYIYNDRKITRWQTAFLGLAQIIPLLFYRVTSLWWIFAAVLAALNAGTVSLEHHFKGSKKSRLLARFLTFALALLTFSIFSVQQPGLILHEPRTRQFVTFLNREVFFFDLKALPGDTWDVGIYLFGLLFLLNETNLIVRLVFEAFGFSPEEFVRSGRGQSPWGFQSASISPTMEGDEYQAGRVIGILERIFVYYAVLLGVYSMIGFITAAKAFARFKELEKRAFAEYVLIGTFISVLIAVLTAWGTATVLR